MISHKTDCQCMHHQAKAYALKQAISQGELYKKLIALS
jgi:hypothetical protein